MLLKSGRELLPPRIKKQSSTVSNDTTSGKAVFTPSAHRGKAKSKQQSQKEVIMANTPSTAPLSTIAHSCSKSRSGSVRSTSSTRSGPLRAIQNVFKVAASPLKSRSRLPPPPQKITIKIQEPRPFLSPLPTGTSLPTTTVAAAAAATTTSNSNIVTNKNTTTNTTRKITSAAAAMRSQADIPRFIIINLNYYDDVPPLDMESPLKRRGVDVPTSSSIIINDNNNDRSLHEA